MEGFNQPPEALRDKGTGQQGHPSAPEPPAISQSRATATRPRSQSAAVEAEHRDSPQLPGLYVPTLLGAVDFYTSSYVALVAGTVGVL